MKSKKIIKIVIAFTSILLIIILINLLSKKTYSISDFEIRQVEYGSYEDAKKIVKEVMKDYYIRGPRMQYNYARGVFERKAPEEATTQDMLYSICSSYSYFVYTEAFGFDYNDNNIPGKNYNMMDDAANYYNKNKNINDKLDGNYLVYYEKTVDEPTRYVYNNATTISDFASIIEPGDIFLYTGHLMMAYEKVQKQDGTWDVFMLESWPYKGIKNRIDGTNKLYYNMFASSKGISNIIDLDKEGHVSYFWLSERSQFVKNGNLSCKVEECSVIRPFYNNNGNAVFSYGINTNNYQRSLLRLKYPGLFIEKTVDKGDNNDIYVDDELTYTIKITNMSNITNGGADAITYPNFKVNETIGDKVSYISSNNESVFENNTISWSVYSLAANESIELSYKVKVNNNLNNVDDVVEANGVFYDEQDSNVTISTGHVNNKIIPKVSNTNKSYKECYNENKNTYNSLELIDKIYECSRNEDFNFNEFVFDKFITKKDVKKKSNLNVISLKNNNNEIINNFQKMILNNYYSGLVRLLVKDDNSNEYVLPEGKQTYVFPRWTNNDKRAKTIYSTDFKDGDVLIYSIDYSQTAPNLIHTKESGLYAFIYIDGKFVGNNYTGEVNERNKFTYSYYNNINYDLETHLYTGVSKLTENQKNDVLTFANYQTLYDKDNYVILRPELVIKEVDNISVEEISKTEYIKNKENLDLKGSKIKVNYNDGTSEEIEITSNNINQFEVSGFDNTKLGTSKITIKYQNVTTTFNVNIVLGTTYVINKYVLDEEKGYISKIDVTTTINDFKKNIELNDGYIIDVEIKNIDNKDVLYTGGKTKIYKNQTLYKEYTNIISGDTNGDGKINYLDYVNVYNHIQKEKHPESSKSLLENEYKIAADMSYDNKISYLDYVMIYNKIKALKL